MNTVTVIDESVGYGVVVGASYFLLSYSNRNECRYCADRRLILLSCNDAYVGHFASQIFQVLAFIIRRIQRT